MDHLLQKAIEETAADLVYEPGQHARVDRQGYSGRNMMGRNCPAIAGSILECQTFIGRLIQFQGKKLVGVPPQDLDRVMADYNTVVDEVMNYSQDQLGHGVVFYWPNSPFTTDRYWLGEVDQMEPEE